jgi:hypothetical protein
MRVLLVGGSFVRREEFKSDQGLDAACFYFRASFYLRTAYLSCRTPLTAIGVKREENLRNERLIAAII